MWIQVEERRLTQLFNQEKLLIATLDDGVATGKCFEGNA
jgi:hypothetical protein